MLRHVKSSVQQGTTACLPAVALAEALLRIRLARRSLGRGRRLHGCQNVRLIAKIFRSHLFDIFKCDGVHGVLELLIKIETEAVKLVEGAMITESIIALIGDLLLADQFLFRAL